MSRDSSLTSKRELDALIQKFESARAVGSGAYASYLRTHGTNPTTAYLRNVKEATSHYDRSLSNYGSEAESLARGGVPSGYAAYLNLAAEGTLNTAKSKGKSALVRTAEENESGYASYLNNLSGKLRTTVNRMRTQGIRQYNDAFAYTVAAGFDADTADAAAALVSKIEAKPLTNADRNTRVRLLREMIDLSLPRDAAYNYALACGLDANAAAELADMCTSVLEGREETRYQ